MGLADLLLNRRADVPAVTATPGEPRALTPAHTTEGRMTELIGSSSLATVLDGGFVTDEDNAKWWGRGDEKHLTTSAIVRRCVNAIAQPLASLELTALNGDGEELDDPFANVFNKGGRNQQLSARMVKETAFGRLELRGQCFLFLDRGASGAGEVAGVTPLYRETKIVVKRDANGLETLAGFKTRGRHAEDWIGLLPSEVLWLRYPSPDDPWGCVAPWTAALPGARLDRMAEKWQETELAAGNRAASVIYLGDMEAEDHARTTALWNRTMVGPDSANRSFLLSGPVKPSVERLGLSAKEVAYLDSRGFNHEEVALAFGIDRDYLFGESTFENKANGRQALWSDTLIPKLEVVSSEVDRQIYPDPQREAGWDVSHVEALQENEDAIVTRLNSLLVNDALLIDEVRAARGLDPLPNGMGAMTLTQYRASVQGTPAAADPTATPDVARIRSVSATERRYVTRRGVRAHRPVIVAHAAAQRAGARVESRAAGVRDEKTVQRVYSRLEARGEKAVKRLAEQQGRAVVRNFQKATRGMAAATELRTGVDEFYDAAFWHGKTKDALETWLGDVYDEGGQRTAAALGLDFDLYDARTTAAMLARLDLLANVVTSTTESVLRSNVLEVAAEEGLSIPDTVALIQQTFTDLSTWRGTMIARTETVGGFNASSRGVAISSGVVQHRQWLAAKDDRVRDSHRQLDGFRTVGMDDPYPNGLMFPGDPSGPSRETIQCRCVELYEIGD